MKRAPLRSIWLVVAAVSCTDKAPARPGVDIGDAALSLLDVSEDDHGPASTDRGAATDRGTATDTATPTDNGSDAGAPTDHGAPTADVAVTADAPVVDAMAVDSGAVDSGTVDSGPQDSGAQDTGAVDSGATDSGATDSGACAPGLASCGPVGGPVECADLRVSTLHCGACGAHCCGISDRCVAGVCTSRCPTLQESCPVVSPVDAGCVATRCVDVSVDDLNCGACGVVCADGTGCVSGRCL
nr:hypothetical protein [Deltaproteobacteria bacterium]